MRDEAPEKPWNSMCAVREILQFGPVSVRALDPMAVF